MPNMISQSTHSPQYPLKFPPKYIACQTPKNYFLIPYKTVSKPCITNLNWNYVKKRIVECELWWACLIAWHLIEC